MLVETFLQERSDRLLALGRAAIAAFALVAVWVDPSQPSSAPAITYALLAVYAAFSLAMLGLHWREAEVPGRVVLAAHVVDLAVYSALMFLTEGSTSPFFLLFTFSLVAATFRWQWRGALWTAVAVLVLLVAIAAAHFVVPAGLRFETDRFVIRCSQVIVLGALLVYFGFRYEQLARKGMRLAAWSGDPALRETPDFLRDCLAHARHVFSAPFVSLVLRDDDGAHLAVLDGGAFRLERIGERELERLRPQLAGEASLSRPASAAGAALPPVPGDPDGFLADKAAFISAGTGGETPLGRLFVASRTLTREDLPLAVVVAAQIGVAIERMRVIADIRHSAAAEERLRLARDVHDGYLQTLAGTALQLETVKQDAERNPALVRPRVERMQEILLSEQRDVRTFLRRLREDPVDESGDGAALSATLADLEQQWGVSIVLDAPPDDALPVELAFDIRQIIREAVANAARHGDASRVSIAVRRSEAGLGIEIRDDGRGFSGQGEPETPRSLRERVQALNGSIASASTAGSGVVLSIRLPSAEGRAA